MLASIVSTCSACSIGSTSSTGSACSIDSCLMPYSYCFIGVPNGTGVTDETGATDGGLERKRQSCSVCPDYKLELDTYLSTKKLLVEYSE